MYACALGALAVPLLVPLPANAQQLTATINGTAYDPTGAAIPNSQVEVRNEATGDIRRTVTNDSGYFTVTALQPGTYSVTVTAEGFAPWQQTGVVLNQGDNRSLPNISLKVGTTTSEVQVVSAAESVAPVDTAEVAQTLNTQMVNNISLQGRDAGELLKIMPGMAMTNGISNNQTFSDRVVSTNTGPVGAFSANGTQPNGAMGYMLDGANLVDPGNQGTQIANINQDMTAEVKVLMSSYGAEYAKGPVLFQAFSKSGTKAFHGEAYFYARNAVLNSEDAYLKQQGIPKPESFEYYPGGNIGGPVILPFTHFNHNHDKLFFWVGYEYMRQQPSGNLWQTFVPTAQMRAGDFSPASLASIPAQSTTRWSFLNTPPCPATPVRNSCNGLTFPNGMIPSNMFDPAALALLKLYPLPNVDPATHGGANFQYLDQTPVNRWEQTEKIDYSISENSKLTVSYALQHETDIHPVQVWWAPAFSLPYPSPLVAPTTANVVMANFTHVFSPTLTNETVFTYARYINPLKPQNPSAIDPASVGFNVPGLFGVKRVQIPNIISWSGNGGFAGFDQQAVFGGGFQGGAFGGLKSDPALYDNLSKVVGTHTMKFGFYWDANANQQSSGQVLNGTYDFETYGGTTTGNLYADMLLGRAANYSQASAIPVDNLIYHQYSIYAQDSWKVGKRLTLNYGIRLDHIGQWYTSSGPGIAVFDPGAYRANPTAVNAGLLWHGIDKSIPQSGFPSQPAYFVPRFGLAYDVFGNGRTVVRGGIGKFPYQIAFNSIQTPAEIPYGVVNATVPANGGLTSLSQITQFNPPTVANAACGTGCAVTALQRGDGHIPYTIDYNFSIDESLPGHMLAEASYVGNQSRNGLINGNFANPNNIPLGAFFGPNPQTGQVIPITQANFPTNDYRPLQSYGDINLVTHGSYANYNSLQFTLQKQTGAVTFITNYTFGKVLGIRDNYSGNGVSAGNTVWPFNINQNYGVLAYDHTHIFNAAYIWNLPKPVHGNAFLAGAVNGWIISGVTQFQSGSPIQPNTNGNLHATYGNVNINGSQIGASTFSYLGSTAANLALMPLLTCDPRNGLQSGQYFNPSCFTAPPVGSQGPLIWPYIKGPAFFDSDLALYKSFRITENQRIEFRASAFNFLNRPNPGFNINGNTSDTTLSFSDPVTHLITNTNQNRLTTGRALYSTGDRLIEFALKYYF